MSARPRRPTGSPASDRPVSLRQRNKRDKHERIRRAARELFTRDGFDATTTRAIAERAGIGTGTLFLYAKDKAALLSMMFREEVDRLERATYASLPRGQRGLVAQLGHVFDRQVDHYRRTPELSRIFFKELLFVGHDHRDEVAMLSRQIVQRLAAVIEGAQRRGEVRPDVSPFVVAYGVFSLFYVALLSWLSGQMDPTAARRLVREALETSYVGLCVRGRAPRLRGGRRSAGSP
jgi:TetR/AcrR family transcriptional regulator, cholesterol catabolism regulator